MVLSLVCALLPLNLTPLVESLVVLVVKSLPVNAGGRREAGLTPGSGRSPGGGRGSPLLHSCLKHPMGRGAWWAAVHGVAERRTPLSDYHTCL